MLRKLNYRPDIDGLRALAVLSVILFHINPSYMPSGFLGVDIFFVISGYLITSIIYREMVEGTFSFANFYNRRIKRILPVFFVTLIFVQIVAFFLFSEVDYFRIINGTITSIFFVINIYLSRGVGYFDMNTELDPLNHIWSLSIEEQFYFIFPLVLLLLLKYKFFRKNLLSILIIINVGLLSLSFINLKEIGIKFDVYYLPHLRMAELLVGSILSIYISKKGNNLSQKQSNILGIVSILILFCCLMKDNFFIMPHFPGFLSLIPCVSAAMLILANEKGIYVKKLFSLKCIVWVGKISYSLYLWHWIVLALFRYFFEIREFSAQLLLIAITLIFTLSVITYYTVEQPIRKKKFSFKKSFLLFYIIPSIIVLVLSYSLQNKITWRQYLPIDCNECTSSKTLTELGDLNSLQNKKILFVGDSHCVHIVPFIDVVGKKEGWKADVLAKAGCPSLLKTKEYEDTKLSDYSECLISRQYFLDNYKKYDVIILANDYSWDENAEPYILKRFELTIQLLLNENKKVYILRSFPIFDVDLQKVDNLKKIGINRDVIIKGALYNKNIERWEQIRASLIKKFPTIEFVDLLPYIPESGYIEGKNIIYDRNHINPYGAKKIAEKFIEEGKVLIKKEDL